MLCGFSCQYILIQKIRLNYTETNDLLKRYVTKDTEETLIYLSQAVQYTGAIVDYKYIKNSLIIHEEISQPCHFILVT